METIVKPIVLTNENFDLVTGGEKPVLVDFWAAWCGPCQMIAPMVEELAEDFGDKAIMAKLDVDANPELAGRFGIRSIPTLMVFKKGQIVDQQVGVVPKNVLSIITALTNSEIAASKSDFNVAF